jgi:succinoglycan biosynthesis protein ExoM
MSEQIGYIDCGAPRATATSKTTIAVAVCTYKRPGPLAKLVESLVVAAAEVSDIARVGLVVVDDDPARSAAAFVESLSGRFELGHHYRVSGSQNISKARNLALDTATAIADWVAMTDDDCEVSPLWLRRLIESQQHANADAVTGPLLLRVPPGSPRWLADQPFLLSGEFDFEDGALVPTAATNNSMIRSRWWREQHDVRFDPTLGVVGGEDMVFYRTASRKGLRIVFDHSALVYGNEPKSRATLHYQLRRHYWLGNTECVTNLYVGDASRPRLFARGVIRLGSSLWRPIGRIGRGRPPQWRFTLASALHAVGLLTGALGRRTRHR